MAASERKSTRQPDVMPSGFFVLRTPLLPLNEFLNWGEGMEAAAAGENPQQLEDALARDCARLRQRLIDVLSRAEVREALFVASPSLDERMGVWRREPDSEAAQKIERAIVRYFSRMAGRATPFGLFAGCTTGRTDKETRLTLDAQQRCRRHTRLDMDYLCALTEALEREPGIRNVLTYRPNSSLYEAAGRLRYAESRLKEKIRWHHLVAVEPNEYLLATLARAREGARPETLAIALVDSDPEISRDEAEQYINELIDSQLLVSELAPAVTGPEPVYELTSKLKEIPAAVKAADCLQQTQASLEAIDTDSLGAQPERYHAIARRLKELPAEVELPRLFQVDMVKPADVALGSEPIAEIIRGVEILHRLARVRQQDLFASFRANFRQRYEEREVPLVDVLDEEVGIGFEPSTAPTAEASPLLEGLLFPPAEAEQTVPWGVRESLLLRKLIETLASGTEQMELTAQDLELLPPTGPLPLPDAFAAMATLAAESEAAVNAGRFHIWIRVASGPTGAILLGRFCHADDALRRHVESHLRAEEALDPEAVFAEIVHLPEGRIGNILLRPLLRDYEIPFLGRSGAPADRQIPITDLLVSVIGDRVVLRSARLGREVIPRLTSAHNYTLRSLGTYRFLCALQQQGVTGGLVWSWGALESASFLPRVVTGRVVLARARWRISREELDRLGKARGAARFSAAQEWRAERHLPRYVVLVDADNELPVDLNNVLSVETFAHLVKDRPQAMVAEFFPAPQELCVCGAEGQFVHELVVPFVRTRQPSPPRVRRVPASTPINERFFPPGSEWLYAKLYTGTATADQVLRDLVQPIVQQALQSETTDRWFFIRYADPDWHLRLRFRCRADRLHQQVLPALQAQAAALLADGRLRRLQLDTYEREIERYGGVKGTELAEQVFCADSEAVLAIVELLAGDEGMDARWRLCFRGIDMLLEDLGFDLEAKRSVMKGMRRGFGQEFQADTTYLKHQLSDKFRQERKALESLLDSAGDEQSPLWSGLAALRRRSQQLKPIVEELKACEQAGRLTMPIAELAPSYAHMHANRLLRSAQRAQELVLYDFLSRIYESQAARIRKGQ